MANDTAGLWHWQQHPVDASLPNEQAEHAALYLLQIQPRPGPQQPHCETTNIIHRSSRHYPSSSGGETALFTRIGHSSAANIEESLYFRRLITVRLEREERIHDTAQVHPQSHERIAVHYQCRWEQYYLQDFCTIGCEQQSYREPKTQRFTADNVYTETKLVRRQ
ncbi:unnamed protein product [Zymoseptoria tritici ST99CH_3D7]|uniref:Uncharacterized protein n=1 Tax=Zymoseptoria tritici (strain ST99CH_3D7) TaxID=1276538 RepID=A0A1X7S7E3_ZYMT9|nr:unnamed protein product [Zymoseptoria tritici ST99CH_3D7]